MMRAGRPPEVDGRAVPICVPALGGNIAVAELVDWLKAPGDTVKRGEVLFEVETDKATIAVVAVRNGRILERARTRGRVNVGQVVGVMSVSAADEPVSAEPDEAVVGRYEKTRVCQPKDAQRDAIGG
jgi:pyruvate/2-oxoglutarate dehydrogenase complex dihydrolipoamide acyltransferase (E2) component